MSIGKVGIAEVPLYTNEAIAALPVRDSATLDPRYLMRALQSMDLTRGSNRAAMGATLNKGSLAELRIPLLNPPEQSRVVAILGHADALRAKRRQVLADVNSLPEVIFADVFEVSSYPSSRLDELIDVGDRINYGVVQPGDDTREGVPLIRVSDLIGGVVDRANLKHVAPDVEASYVRSRIRGNEILVSCVGSIGSVSLVGAEDVGSNVARAVARVPISDAVLRTYVAAYLRTPTPQRYFVAQLRTVAQPTLTIGQLAATQVPIPPVDLQRSFCHRLRKGVFPINGGSGVHLVRGSPRPAYGRRR